MVSEELRWQKKKRKEKKEDRLIFYAWDIKTRPIKDIL